MASSSNLNPPNSFLLIFSVDKLIWVEMLLCIVCAKKHPNHLALGGISGRTRGSLCVRLYQILRANIFRDEMINVVYT